MKATTTRLSSSEEAKLNKQYEELLKERAVGQKQRRAKQRQKIIASTTRSTKPSKEG